MSDQQSMPVSEFRELLEQLRAPKEKRRDINREEQIIQQACIKAFDALYPHHKPLLASNLNNSKDKITGGINKSMGVRPGRNDLSLEALNTVYRFEIKAPTGHQSPAQKAYQQLIQSQFGHYQIIRSASEFINAVKPIMSEHISKYPMPPKLKFKW